MENKLNLAGLENRIVNAIIDMIAFFVIWFLLSIILMALGLRQTFADGNDEFPVVPLAIILPTFWGYYIISEYKFQKTLGKLLTKTKVTSLTGDRPTLTQIIFRTLSRSIPFEYFSYLITVEGIHDRLSKTRVIKISATGSGL